MSTGVRRGGCRNWAVAALAGLVVAAGATAVLALRSGSPSQVWIVPPVLSASSGAVFTNLRAAPDDEESLDGYSARPSKILGDGTIAAIDVSSPVPAWQRLLGRLMGRYVFEPARRYVATDATRSIKGVEWRKFVPDASGAR